MKGTPNKWLDLVRLTESMLKPGDKLIAVKYFTAKISSNDPRKALRQNIYLEALSQNPKKQIKLGHFSVHKTKMPLSDEWDKGRIKMVEVVKTEEKGTDVNLAVQMVVDAKDDLFDYALLFSNDSDMAYAVQIAVRDCGKQIGLFIARKDITYKDLQENVLHIKRLSAKTFSENQLPETITSSTGRIITKPKVW